MIKIRIYTVNRTGKEGMKMDKEEQKLVQNLNDAGCCASECEAFLHLDECEQKVMLEKKRQDILGELHIVKKKLDCLDYLRYQYQKK
jgi:mevalonate kinase